MRGDIALRFRSQWTVPFFSVILCVLADRGPLYRSVSHASPRDRLQVPVQCPRSPASSRIAYLDMLFSVLHDENDAYQRQKHPCAHRTRNFTTLFAMTLPRKVHSEQNRPFSASAHLREFFSVFVVTTRMPLPRRGYRSYSSTAFPLRRL